MNDFTKEELIVLEQAFNGACKAFSNDKFDAALEIKLQSMIDNYCEHKEKTYSKKTGKPVCPICHTYFGDNGDDIEARLKGYTNE